MDSVWRANRDGDIFMSRKPFLPRKLMEELETKFIEMIADELKKVTKNQTPISTGMLRRLLKLPEPKKEEQEKVIFS